jgi:hypothetical protein
MLKTTTFLIAVAGLALSAGSARAAATLGIERDVTVDSMVSDRFTWIDAAGQPRVAVLAHNDGQVGPGGTRGGELRLFQYNVGGIPRVVRASSSGAAGFGYVVAHRSEGTAGIAEDDSPLGHGFTGQFQRVFEGRHHAIFRFTQLYPRHSKQDTGGAGPNNQRYDVPVTVEWVVATGKDNPLWAISWDLSDVPVNAVESDSRAPYGELLFDGAATEGAHSVIAGVGWGDRFRFATPDAGPLSYNSAWTWNTVNTVPYVKLWTSAVNATMGTVQTQTILQQDAGGYYGVNRWNTTSAGGKACNYPTQPYDDGFHLMPCDFKWPYQSVNYSLNPAAPANQTNNTRLAWGANFGFLGQSQYLIHGSSYYGGPLADTYAPGWPRKSYSTYVVLGVHTPDAVDAQRVQVETVQSTAVTAAVGSVVASGPAGVNRADTVTYAPAGWNHVYGAWALSASSNQIDANMSVGAGTLVNPLVIVSSWTSPSLPTSLRFKGAALTEGTGYFASVRTGAQELWITLNANVSGGTNRLEIAGSAPPPPTTFPQYRLFYLPSGEHLYTTDFNEYSYLGAHGWNQEGIAYYMFPNAVIGGAQTVPLYRLYAPGIAQHHWTTDAHEVAVLSANGDWSYEGIVGYLLPVQQAGSAPLYRLALPSPLRHLWTTDAHEYAVLKTDGWLQEGYLGYAVPVNP